MGIESRPSLPSDSRRVALADVAMARFNAPLRPLPETDGPPSTNVEKVALGGRKGIGPREFGCPRGGRAQRTGSFTGVWWAVMRSVAARRI